MADVQLIRYRLEPGKKDRLYEWTKEVESRRDEAVETLRDENVFSEAAFFESREDGDYVSFYVEAEDIETATRAFENSSHDIDREFKNLLREVVAEDQPDERIELLYHLANPERP